MSALGRRRSRWAAVLFVLLGSPAAALAAEPAEKGGEAQADVLARQLANPLSNLVSVPFQLNVNMGTGPEHEAATLLNVQPVLPIALGGRWLLITRTIVPVINQPAAPGEPRISGIGDALMSLFFSPKPSGALTVAAGPVFSVPIASKDALGTSRFSVGPTAIVLAQTGPWTYGALANQLWSVAGDVTRPSVNQLFLQPFFTHTPKGGYTITLSSEVTGNWEAPNGQGWTVPAILTASKTFAVGGQHMSVALGGRYNFIRPDQASSWGVRLVYTLVFPVAPAGKPEGS